MTYMDTIKQVATNAEVSTRTVQRRAKILGFLKRYRGDPGTPIRIFTKSEAEQIINWTGAKPGRKKHER